MIVYIPQIVQLNYLPK